ncbi:MAG: thioredoxin family protein [Saprospiraceae bacterium]|nr:thioredoxin family protein [Saprospiraceae bacterium]
MRFFIPVLLFAIFTLNLRAQGIEFFHGTWAEALEKAKGEEKLIFVDAFASWCGPCKRMAKETFPDEKVGAFFNGNFICLKIDMEKPENAEFAGKFPVNSYPTLFFIDGNGKVVLREIGAKSVDQLIETGKRALGKNDKSVDYEKKYNEGNRDPKMLFDYVRALNAAGKPSLKITNEYLNTQSDLTTEFNLRFMLEGAVDADSRVFDLMVKNKQKIAEVAGEEAFNARVETACKNTLKKAVEYKNEALLKETKAKMKLANPARAEAFGSEVDMFYYKAVKDSDNYLKAAKTLQKASVKSNAAKLHELTIDLVRSFPEDKKVLDQAEKWAKSAAETGGLADYWMTLAGIYKLKGEKNKARETAEKAKDAAGNGDSMLKSKIDYFIQSLE